MSPGRAQGVSVAPAYPQSANGHQRRNLAAWGVPGRRGDARPPDRVDNGRRKPIFALGQVCPGPGAGKRPGFRIEKLSMGNRWLE